MPAGKVTKATKKIKGSKGFGKGIATQKKIGRVKRSKDERMEKSIKAEAKATKVVPVLAAVAKGCSEFRPRERAAVRDVLPKVKALQKLLR